MNNIKIGKNEIENKITIYHTVWILSEQHDLKRDYHTIWILSKWDYNIIYNRNRNQNIVFKKIKNI